VSRACRPRARSPFPTRHRQRQDVPDSGTSRSRLGLLRLPQRAFGGKMFQSLEHLRRDQGGYSGESPAARCSRVWNISAAQPGPLPGTGAHRHNKTFYKCGTSPTRSGWPLLLQRIFGNKMFQTLEHLRAARPPTRSCTLGACLEPVTDHVCYLLPGKEPRPNASQPPLEDHHVQTKQPEHPHPAFDGRSPKEG
jgi:hypothetical protein